MHCVAPEIFRQRLLIEGYFQREGLNTDMPLGS
jgi:hypothetical protein